MIYYSKGSHNQTLTAADISEAVASTCNSLKERKRILLIPPDFSRMHSQAGSITCEWVKNQKDRIKTILPALGTHRPMTSTEISTMFPGVEQSLFKTHNWQANLTRLGVVPADFIKKISENVVCFDWPAEVSGELMDPAYDLIVSIGQVVPHEVAGMANYTKNIFVGVGGAEGINKSHFLGAAYGMERIMGQADNPVRKLLNHARAQFIPSLPIVYFLTVIGTDSQGRNSLRGLFVGDDDECYYQAAALSAKLNIHMLDKPLKKAVVYLNPDEYKSTWLGNKAIYRTRCAMANHGELVIMAPGVREFGENPGIDKIIRKYGYTGTEKILLLMQDNHDLQENLGTTAHLIHGSSEGRFRVTYAPGHLTQQEIEHANFHYQPPAPLLKKYDPAKLSEGFNTLPDGEEIFFISNPATGLWEYNTKETIK